MTHDCPLCPESHDERTALRIHLEVEHRKSELVSCLLAGESDDADDRRLTVDNERVMPSV
jgi:hypothetical protein